MPPLFCAKDELEQASRTAIAPPSRIKGRIVVSFPVAPHCRAAASAGSVVAGGAPLQWRVLVWSRHRRRSRHWSGAPPALSRLLLPHRQRIARAYVLGETRHHALP